MRKYAAMGLTAVLAAASFPAAVLADEADVKSVRIGAPYDPVTMDYAELNVDPATYIDTLISDTLIRSKQGEYIGGAAESWETSEDGKTWTFKTEGRLNATVMERHRLPPRIFVYAAKRLMDQRQVTIMQRARIFWRMARNIMQEKVRGTRLV